ncbi:TPA: hypothetical protein ACGU44_001426 [Enterococcus faecium]|uniref:Uncharacterized protein n=3 Tax=Enterococcus faecium TaxID=1352 RepID=A0A132Z7T5_ENTFC|nr:MULTISPECIES: hypothetical protein [Enterococcus]HAQ1583302.1 hypothetical protein [Enterococcus faecium Efm-HS0661]AOM23777.1 hypothetical protein AL016_15420 [Enterococcus faecium]AQT55576.1 hypothetical protein BVA20_00095 [Enterococcus faecium]AQY30201.1 hypothetical protein B4W80_14980 [Enterococcus faecium]AQY33648.1 hypothetical protein B4W81_17085 [Enterococcus faecium]
MENNNDIRYFSIGERVTTVSELSKDYRDKEGTIISLKKNRRGVWQYVVDLGDGVTVECKDSQLIRNDGSHSIEKAILVFPKVSSKIMNDWLLGKFGEYNKKEIAEVIGKSYPTVLGYLKKITNKEAKVEDVLTVRELQSLIEYRNKQITNPEYLKKEDGLLKQLEQVNKIRKMQKVAPLSLDNFKKIYLKEIEKD